MDENLSASCNQDNKKQAWLRWIGLSEDDGKSLAAEPLTMSSERLRNFYSSSSWEPIHLHVRSRRA
jgi:hypothetical protein